MVMIIVRVFKWNGMVEQAIDVYNSNLPPETSNHFAVGTIHKPMILLLRICDDSPAQYNNTEELKENVELALQFDVDDMTDNIYTADGWSMKSLASELCLHLARRLPPGNPIRETLVDRGLSMSSIANQRIKASNGLIKHILAYDAHAEIHVRLLNLGKEDNAISRSIIYTQELDGEISKESNSKTSTFRKHVSFDESNQSSASTAVGLAERLVMKDENSDNTPLGSAILKTMKSSNFTGAALPSAPSQVNPNKRVSFSQVSSMLFYGC
jgi:hypothetical protein